MTSRTGWSDVWARVVDEEHDHASDPAGTCAMLDGMFHRNANVNSRERP